MPNKEFKRFYDCKKNPCHNTPKKGCELNNLIRKFRVNHDCPCYSCIVKTMCKTLCKDYTTYVDPIFIKEYYDLYQFKQEDKYESNGKLSNEFLSLLVDRIAHYRPHEKAFVELDEIEYEDHSEYNTVQIIFNKE